MAHTSTASSDAVISALAAIHPESNGMKPKMWIDSVKQVCISDMSLDDSITSVLQRCHAFSSQDVGVVFMKMLSYVELAVKCQRCASCVSDDMSDIFLTINLVSCTVQPMFQSAQYLCYFRRTSA